MGKTDVSGLFPSDGFSLPAERRGQASGDEALPPGTFVFSADNHISVAQDIWYERFPARLKDRAPRVWFDDGVFNVGFDGASLLGATFRPPLRPIDAVPGSDAANIDLRMADLDNEGISAELVFANGILALMTCPDLEVRELCFRIYNEYLAELQARAPGRFYGVGLINYWDAKGARETLAELKSLGLRTFLVPLKAPGAESRLIDWTSPATEPVWDEIEDAGLPVSHHIGENPPRNHYNATTIGLLNNTGSFRQRFGEYVFGGILDRHPALRIGWFEGGINWILSAIQDARYAKASFGFLHNWEVRHDVEHYWKTHMFSSFIYDTLGLELIDRIGADRVMWSSDYPHCESTIGHTQRFLKTVADAVDPSLVPQVVAGNVMRYLGL